MGYKRTIAPARQIHDRVLTEAMAGIGMGFAARPERTPNIEDTLLFASIEAMDKHDLRTLDLLVTWFGTHHAWINADRMITLVAAQSSARVQALWAALAAWRKQDRRFAKLLNGYDGPRVDALPAGTDFQVGRHGEDARFADTPLRVPANLLRGREEDVLAPARLARLHPAYRHRLMIGPSYRADVWALLEAEPHLSASELARRTYASFATAHQAKQAFSILKAGDKVGFSPTGRFIRLEG